MKITKYVKSLELNNIGWLEFLFAATPMLGAYSLAGLPLSAIMWVILLFVVFLKYKKLPLANYKPLTMFFVYWIFITIFMLSTGDVNLNSMIFQVVYFLSVFALYPCLNIRKLIGSLNWVALISIVGLLYQWAIIVTGGGVHPLEIPGLDMDASRLEVLSFRPSSFFAEPAAYVAFMIVPLAFSLIEKKYLWATIMILSIFITTSTTGLVSSFIILATYFSTQKIGYKRMSLIVLVGIGLLFILTKADVFGATMEKLYNTDTEDNVRLTQGPYVVSTMKVDEFLLGSGSSSPYDYCVTKHRAPMVVSYGESVYMSTFWLIILEYGIVGLLLYLYLYMKLIRLNKVVVPLTTCLLAVIFSSGYGIGPTFIFHIIVLLVMANQIIEHTTTQQ